MSKRKTKKLTRERWIVLSSDPAMRKSSLKGDRYSLVYNQLLAYIAKLPNTLAPVHALICVHLVYGWMPTILDPLGVRKAFDDNSDRLLTVVNAARGAKKPGISDEDLNLLKGFANNSTVGVSKLLQFLNPYVLPIWDSRVANRYLWRGVSRYTYDNVHRLQEYTDTLWDWSRNPEVKAACKSLVKACPNTDGCTTIRLTELVLFHHR